MKEMARRYIAYLIATKLKYAERAAAADAMKNGKANAVLVSALPTSLLIKFVAALTTFLLGWRQAAAMTNPIIPLSVQQEKKQTAKEKAAAAAQQALIANHSSAKTLLA